MITVDYILLQEVQIISVDSLGFDVRVCSGTQVQTLRFAFKKRVPLFIYLFFKPQVLIFRIYNFSCLHIVWLGGIWRGREGVFDKIACLVQTSGGKGRDFCL